MTRDAVRVTDFHGIRSSRNGNALPGTPFKRKGRLQTFHAQRDLRAARAVRETVEGRISLDTGRVFLDEMKNLNESDLKNINSIKIAACGTSWHAGIAGKYMIEQLARINVDVDSRPNFSYRDPVFDDHTLLW